MRFLVFFILLLISSSGFAQFAKELLQQNSYKVQDTILIQENSIQNKNFFIVDRIGNTIDSTFYKVDFAKAKIYLNKKKVTADSITVNYLKYPNFLTQDYYALSDSLIVPKNTAIKRYYKLSESKSSTIQVFDGLNSTGSISRAVTVGNNQNTVVDSQLDLQLSGKLSDKVTLQASLQDANIPIQEGGYSQSLDEFDQIFVSLSSKNWNIRAGDIQVVEDKSVFSNFTKKLQGLTVQANIEGEKSKTRLYASGALVRGVFNSSTIAAQEGNQGPYKLIGDNGELFVLIVSGSERVYVNGLQLQRGQNKDYVIDYNAGEILFNTTYPVTSNMRIVVEYQVSQQNFARILGVVGADVSSKNWNLNAFFYTENDLRNQSLLQNLNNEQKQVLSTAGDDETRMVADAATPTAFSENQVLYQNIGSEESPIYQQYIESEPTSETLFQVQFKEVGFGNGNYILENEAVVNEVYVYRSPVNGVLQGNYEPVTQLSAPIKLQIGVVRGDFMPNESTSINFELAASRNDLNLFSNVDDNDNNGGAYSIKLNQKILNNKGTKSSLNTFIGTDFIHRNFVSVERSYNVEFNRDWNLDEVNTSQLLTNVGLEWKLKQNLITQYSFQRLDAEEIYRGNRHFFTMNANKKNWQLNTSLSALESKGEIEDTEFIRGNSNLSFNTKKLWSGVKWGFEDNEEVDVNTGEFKIDSQRFNAYELYAGRGDSTKVYLKAGYQYRVNDSILDARLQRVAKFNTWYANSTLVNKTNTSLQAFVNYRILEDTRESEKDKSLNTRLQYRQNLWKNTLQLNTLFETQNGSFAQQDFTYVKVDAGNGVYTWIDYNENGLQDFDEFEISVFTDQAEYVRVLLPNQTFLSTNQNKFSQQVSWNFTNFIKAESGFKRLLSHIYNQTSYLVDRRVLKDGNTLNFNFFDDSLSEIGLNLSVRNSLFLNRGKQKYSFTYNYLDTETKSVILTGLQSNKGRSHELLFAHKIKESWLLNSSVRNSLNENFLENSVSQNYTIESLEFNPKVSYLFGDKHNFFIEYGFAEKENIQTSGEFLKQQSIGLGLRLASKDNGTITANLDWVNNDFSGNEFSSVAYQLLEGLQAGENYVWKMFIQKKLTKYLELNLNYSGRKSNDINTIHTGSVQLRAFF